MAEDSLFTSGSYLTKGSIQGGKIQLKADNLLLVASKFDATGEKKGGISLEHAEKGIYYTNTHTQLLGETTKNTYVNKNNLLKSDLLGSINF